jgi:predicted Zn-dependent peptidase
VAHAFAEWRKSGAASPIVTDLKDPARRVHLVHQERLVQTTLAVGAPGSSRLSPDYDVLAVLNHIIGSGPAATLHEPPRTEGLTYNASSTSLRSAIGALAGSHDVRTDATDAAPGGGPARNPANA